MEFHILFCDKCGDETTVRQSKELCKNSPLKRSCCDCQATDRKRQRACAEPKPAKLALETDDEKAARAEARRVRDEVNKLEKSEQQKWYKNEKTKRAAQSKNKPRTLSDPKAYNDEFKEDSKLTDTVDRYIDFEEFAIRQIALRRAESEKECVPLWDAALKMPGAVVVKSRNQYLLGVFGGVEARKRQAAGMRTGLRESHHVHDEEELVATMEEGEETRAKFSRRMGKELEVAASSRGGPLIDELDIDTLRNEGDMREGSEKACILKKQLIGKFREQEKQASVEEQALLEQAIEHSLKKEEEKKRKAAQEVQPKNRAVEKIALETAISNAKGVMEKNILHQGGMADGINVELESILGPKAEMTQEDLK